MNKFALIEGIIIIAISFATLIYLPDESEYIKLFCYFILCGLALVLFSLLNIAENIVNKKLSELIKNK